MSFFDQNGKQIDTRAMEYQEQVLAHKFVPEDATVLELGARYGTVTCAISNKQKHSGKLVCVEPDERVWEALEANIIRNGAKAHIIKGFLSQKPISLTNLDNWYGGYGATFVDDTSSRSLSVSLSEVESRYGLRFDTLVADCEGFLERFFDENTELFDRLRVIIYEADYPDKCNYTRLETEFQRRGFRYIKKGHQNVLVR
jgi:FkbM family methyltransferase